MSSLRHSGNASNAFPHVVRHAFAQGNEYTMDDHATPQPNVTHEIPSLPSSPQPKRTKYTEPAAPHLSVAGESNSPAQWPSLTFTAILNDAAPTPTPQTTFQPPTMAEPRALPSMPPISLEPPPPTLQVKLLAPSAKAPTRGSAYAAGCDIYASKATVVPARGKVLVDTDISIAVPANTYGRVAPRSGLASKHSIDVGAGVIDADYRGPVKVLLFNLGDKEFEVAVGERVAQLIIERVRTAHQFWRPNRLTLDRFTHRTLWLWSSSRTPFAELADSGRRAGLAARFQAYRETSAYLGRESQSRVE